VNTTLGHQDDQPEGVLKRQVAKLVSREEGDG
jgi:hypothetical protein